MKRIVTILLTAISLMSGCGIAMAQTSPTSPVGPVTTNTLYFEPGTKNFWSYLGSTYGWRQWVDSVQLKRNLTHWIPGTISATSPLFYNSGTGVLTIQQANGSQNGYLSNTDWMNFNGKQNALSGTGYVRQSGASTSYDSSSTVLSTIGAVDTARFPVWRRQGIVMSPGATGDQNINGESSIIIEGSPQILTGATTVFKMWYTQGWSTANTCYAESLDGITWTKYSGNPVVANHYRNSVIKVGSTYHMYVSASTGTSQIDHYTSSNGVTWTLANSAVISHGSAGSWNSTGVHNTAVIYEGGTYKMLLEGSNDAGIYSIGYYTSPDGAVFTPYGSNPVLSGMAQGGPCINKVGSTYYVWVHGTEGNSVVPTDIFRFSSPDLINWSRTPISGAVLQRRTLDEGAFQQYGQIGDVYVIEYLGKTYMFYSANQNGHTNALPGYIKLAIANLPLSKLVTTSEGDGLLDDPTAIFNGTNTWYKNQIFQDATFTGHIAVNNSSATPPTQSFLVGDFSEQNVSTTTGIITADMAPVSQLWRNGTNTWEHSIGVNGDLNISVNSGSTYTDAALLGQKKFAFKSNGTFLTSGVGLLATPATGISSDSVAVFHSGVLKEVAQSTFAPAAQGISSASIVWPGTLYTTPTTGVISGNVLTFSPALANQSAHSWFGNATSGSTTPSFNTSAFPVVMGGTGTITQFTQGNVVFAGASGIYSQDNLLFWDATHHWLGINATPSTYLSIHNNANSGYNQVMELTAPNLTTGNRLYWTMGKDNSNVKNGAQFEFYYDNNMSNNNAWAVSFAGTNDILFVTAGGLTGLNTNTPGSTLQVNGGAAIGYSSSTAAPTNGLQVSGHTIFEGVTSTGATGTGNLVYSISPSFTGTPTAPTAAVGTNTTQIATTAFVLANGITNPMTTLGDIIYGGASGVATRLAGNTTSTQKFLTQTGTGSVSAAPAYFDLFGSSNTFTNNNYFSNAVYVYNGTTATAGAISASGLTASRTYGLPDLSGTFVTSPNGAFTILASTQTTLVSGTKALSITGVTTGSHAYVTVVSQGGTVTTTMEYAAVCTSGTVTITALTTGGATNATDTSVINILITN